MDFVMAKSVTRGSNLNLERSRSEPGSAIIVA